MKLRFTPPLSDLFRQIGRSQFVLLVLLIFAGCVQEEDVVQSAEQKLTQEELLAKAKDYYDLNSTFGKPESNAGRVSNYGDYFPVWEKSKLVERQATFLVAPYYRWMNREYGDQNYIRRLVFEYGTEGELLRAGVIELISGTLSLRQLAERHEAVIDQYLIGNPSEEIGIVWSDINMNELEGMAEDGRKAGISSDSDASARLADVNCVYYFYVLTDQATGIIISATFLYKDCLPPNFSESIPCDNGGLRLDFDSGNEGANLPCPDLDGGIGGETPTLEDCEALQMMGYDVECLTEEQIDMDNLSDCHKDIIKGLVGSTQQEFKRIFEKFNGDQPVPTNYNVKFQYGECGSGASACTSKFLNNGWSTITIDNNINQNATDLSLARTILHEMLHAYLLFEQNYPSDCDLNCLLNDYIINYGGNDLNDPHHNLFVETKFLKDIEVELKNYASSLKYNISTLGNEFFKDMAWGGLTETDVFKNSKTISVQNRIKDRINAEIKGESIVRPINNSEGGYTNVITTPKALNACD